jgi:ribosomal-protein-alanine N-acetyltransferase
MLKSGAEISPTTSFAIRGYLASDFDRLLEIDQACFAPAIAYSREELAQFIEHPDSRTWVAEGGGKVVGFGVAAKVPPERLHLVTLDVVAGWRRSGIGRALMKAAEDFALEQRLQVISLEAAEDNLQALSFYQKLGFRKRRLIPAYYADGTAAWLMEKSLA